MVDTLFDTLTVENAPAESALNQTNLKSASALVKA
jgi:hypothetical protein